MSRTKVLKAMTVLALARTNTIAQQAAPEHIVAALFGSPASPASSVNPLIGSRHGGNTFSGPMLPFGMLQWSPETTRGKHHRSGSRDDAPQRH